MSVKAMTWAYEQKSVKAGPKSTLVALCDFLNEKTGQCNPRIKIIAKRTGYDHRTIRRHLNILEEARLIKRIVACRDGRRCANFYQINCEIASWQNVSAPMTNHHEGDDSLSLPPHDKMTWEINEPENIKPVSKTPVVPLHDFKPEFEEFWSSWRPLTTPKGNKQNALKKFNYFRKKGISYETIAQGSERYLEYCHRNECWTKHISTWLNQRGWEDEYPATNPARGIHRSSKSASYSPSTALSIALADQTRL